LNYAIRTYIHEKKAIENFDDNDLEEIIESKNALNNAETIKNENKPNVDIDEQKINMLDLETALSYMLRKEIPRMKEIQGDSYDSLIHWINVLVKVIYF